jgi:NAD-dependent SIR2 family protein deacetylase
MQAAFLQNPDDPTSISDAQNAILELHGSLKFATCLQCHQRTLRDDIQKDLLRLNPSWTALLRLDPAELKINADGDVDIQSLLRTSDQFQYDHFRYPACQHCISKHGDTELLEIDKDGAWKGGIAGVMKPSVTFFGENVDDEVQREAFKIIDGSEQFLIIGTTLAVLSAQRLVRRAKQAGKQIAILTSGYVRGEEKLLQTHDIRISWRSSEVLRHISL